MFLATGPVELAVLLDQDVRQAAGAALLGPLLPGVELLARLRPPPGITTAPTYGAWKTRNGVSSKYVGAVDELWPIRRSGLSEP